MRHGDATSDEVLRRAGLEHARALVAVVARRALIVMNRLSASEGGAMVFNPEGQTVLEEDDTLILLGHRNELDHVARRAAQPA